MNRDRLRRAFRGWLRRLAEEFVAQQPCALYRGDIPRQVCDCGWARAYHPATHTRKAL